MLLPSEIAVAYAIGFTDEAGVLDWAQEYASVHSEIDSGSSVIELLWYNAKRKDESAVFANLLKRAVLELDPHFDIHSEPAQACARNLFRSRLREYLDGDCRPWDVCTMIDPIEQLYDFPSWLGALYDACDWVAPGSDRATCPGLEDEIRRCLDAA